MSKTIRYTFDVGGVLTDVTSVVLRAPDNSFGVRRTDNNAVVVASGTPLAHLSTGVYEYTFAEPASNLSYEYWIERVFSGNTKRTRQILESVLPSSGAGGSIPIPPSAYVAMGVETVSCGDAALEAFLTQQANLIWAMQLRRGVVLDLRYQYFVLDLIHLALDHVRMLIDTEIAGQQTQETGYNNSTSVSDSSATSSNSRTSSSTQSASSSQTFVRTASRTSSSQSASSSTQSSTREGVGSDSSTQTQTSKTTGASSNHSSSQQKPGDGTQVFSHSLGQYYKKSVARIQSTSDVVHGVRHQSVTLPAPFGTFSAQSGLYNNSGDLVGVNPDNVSRYANPSVSKSYNRLKARDSASVSSTRRRKTEGSGTAISDSTTVGTSSRTNVIHRSSTGSATGSSTATQSSTMASSSHDEAHRESESAAHSESLGHSESLSTMTAQRTGQGASSMVGSSNLNKQYYDQIFQSLQQMFKDTVEQIKQLEKQVSMTTRVILQKLAVRTPQAGIVRSAAARTSISQSPFGTPFNGIDQRTVR